jgi:hypothetical protein
LVGRAVKEWSLSERVGHDGALAVSELVTNSVLHAGTPVHVRINRAGRGLRIEVGDGNPYIPPVDAARPEDLLSNRSMTGRGLALVAATSDGWGSESCDAGKITWAEVGTGRRRAAGRRGAAPRRGRSVQQVGPNGTAKGRQVHLVGVPVALLLESTRQLSDLNREVQVMALGREAPEELSQVVQAIHHWIPDLDQWTDSERRVAEHAAAGGQESIDFDVVVPDDIAERIEGIADWLRRAARGINRRHLLTLPPTAEVTAYREWFAGEIMRQLAGCEPCPCPVKAGQPSI